MYLRKLTTIKFSTPVLCVLAALTLAGCGGGGGGGTMPGPTVLPLALPAGHGLSSGEITVAPGESEEHGNIVLSCPAGGQACVLNVAADGSASYARTGGMPSIMPALAAQTLPAGHGLAAGDISVAAGQSMEHGNVVVSCPAGGNACVLNVAADGSASYARTGGMPSIMPALAAQTLPAGHGLAAGDISVDPGQSMEHGNVVVSCPAGGQACVLNVAADGSASYARTGGMPSIMPAFAAQTLPPGHGLSAGDISVAPGQSMEHGNVVISCPAGGEACVLAVAADGSASYQRTGGIPSIMAALAAQTLPAGHGLAAGDITVDPGQSMERGNVIVSCPAGGETCVLKVAADGSATYEKTGGMPSFMPALAAHVLPTGHGLPAGDITVAAGTSDEHGNVVVSCPASGEACVLVVAADGSASYQRTGGVPSVRPIPLMVGPGQNLSDTSPVFANDETGSLKEALDAGNVLPTLAATLVRHRGDEQSTELSEDFIVKGIRRNAGGEYVINYVIDGTEEEITLDTGNCSSFDCEFFVDGRRFFFWSWTRDDDDPSIEDGLGEFRYLASHGLSYNPTREIQARTWFVFGVRTEDLPMGTATHHGRFSAWGFRTANPDWNMRLLVSGTMRLVANFDMRSLDGRIYRIRGRRADENSTRTWETSSFAITEGRIVNGQFTATLTGLDSDPTTPFDASVRGFMGHILGEFYGPNAEEVGGVVTATRDVAGTADDRVLHGFIGGRKTDRLTGVNDSEALLMGFARDFEEDSTTLVRVDSLTVETTADGYRITWSDDGDETVTVELGESDFGTPNWSTSYVKESNGSQFRLWSSTGAFTGTHFTSRRSYRNLFRPEHFDVMSWVLDDRDASGDRTSSNFGRIVYGDRTTDMPTTGTASYDGGGFVMEWPTDEAAFFGDPSVMYYRTNLDLSADFGNSAVTGNLTLLEASPGDGAYAPASGGLSFNATISGNGLSATDLSGSGALSGYSGGRVDGAFYGPGATEVGGVLDATHDTQNKVITGHFAGQRQ